ncbi:hypothetical protein GKE82_26540 [Conexibacter sp. W3-3-2]|uniref:MCE family protein n=1 Tax=Conexibacter sp. W3-3-2 TaxID=2675227 RepID=UPI0012BA2C0D|nr:MCE family protein [Conexibacter sp. W3-3-2]MTD47759.1 hypothetical protein [Conexibacter sp. W3-3-2]
MLIPTSALKDLRIDIVPGHAAAGRLREGATIPIARTAPPIDADELLSALDGDTRSFRAVLLGESGRATAGRGNDLRALLRAVGPTAAQLRGVARTLARRNREVRRLVTNLAAISRTVGPRDADLGRVVQGAAATVEAVAGQQRSLDRALQQLPGTLRTVSGTLAQIPSFGDEASASLRALRPAIERLPGALDAAAPLAREAGPIVRTQLRPAVRELQPLARDLHALTPDLSRVTPSLTSAFRVLTYTVDELAFNPRGDDEGFLYWVAWSAHNLNSVVSGGDAHGAFIRAIALIDCDSLTGSPLLVGLGVQAVLGGVVPTCPKARP